MNYINQKQMIEQLFFQFTQGLTPLDVAYRLKLMFQFQHAHWYFLDHYPEVSRQISFLKFCYGMGSYVGWNAREVRAQVKAFNEYNRNVLRCGMVMLNPDCSKVLLVRSVNGRSLGFPRGKINYGETPMACAVREAYEETGFWCVPHETAPFDYFRRFDTHTERQSIFFTLNVPEDFPFQAQHAGEIAEYRWVPITHMPRYLRFAHHHIERVVSSLSLAPPLVPLDNSTTSECDTSHFENPVVEIAPSLA